MENKPAIAREIFRHEGDKQVCPFGRACLQMVGDKPVPLAARGPEVKKRCVLREALHTRRQMILKHKIFAACK